MSMFAQPADADFYASLPRKRMAAGLLLRDGAGRALLVRPRYKSNWEIPGGVVEADESPRAAVLREIDEELGLSRIPGRLLAVDWVPPHGARTEGLMLVFDGGTLTPDEIAAIRVASDELHGYEFCTPQRAEQRLSALLARRLHACLHACATATVAYLEDGNAVPAG